MAFITNSSSMLDLPHKLTVWFKRKLHHRAQQDCDYVTPFEDTFEFELPYFLSYTLVIFLDCLLYSSVVPLIPFFAMIFFFLKYLIDKYHLVFTYYQTVESGGHIRDYVKLYMYFNLYIYMVVIPIFFSLKFNIDLFTPGAAIAAFWTILIVIYEMKKSKIKVAQKP